MKLLSKPIMMIATVPWIAVAATLVYWQWFDNKPIYTYEDIYVVGGKVRIGEPLVLYSSFCVSYPFVRNSMVRQVTELSSGVVFVLDIISAIVPPGCFQFMPSFPLPSYLKPGKYTYEFKALFIINPIKKVFGGIKPVPFELVE